MKKITLAFVLVLFAGIAFSQDGTVRGFVYDQDNGEPIIFTNVYLQGTSYGAATDVNGYYAITKIPKGNYTLMVTYLGYDTLKIPIAITGNEIITEKLFLKKGAVQLGEIEISAEKKEALSTVKISVEKITPKEIQQIPTVGGESDIAQYLQILPGVVFTGDQGGQLYIRGGSPVQNKVLLDGMIIYNPFHSIGLFSVFDTDILRNADVYTGGYSAQYGGRISSIMDITTRDGNKKQFGAKISASTFGAKALIEGPLKKQSNSGGGSSSFIISAKTSYLDQSADQLYTYVNDGEGLPFSFTDVYGKLSFNGSNGSKFNLFGFNFTDNVKYQAVSDLGWESIGVGMSTILVPAGSRTLISGNFAFTDYKISLEEENNPPRSSQINGFNFGMNFKYFSGDNELNYGFELLGFGTDYNFQNAAGLSFEQSQNTTELGGFFDYKIKTGQWVIQPSIRAQYYASLTDLSLEPRFGVKFNATENFRLKGAAGIYSQNLIQTNSDRDIVNLFYGFLSGPDNIQNDFLTENGDVIKLKHKLQKANHYIVGFEYDLSGKIQLNVETYRKDFTQLANVNRNKIYEDNAGNNDIPDVQKKDFIIETGTAMGGDVVIKYKDKKKDFWAVYSLNKVDRWDGVQTYAPVFDRRHNINLLATYRLGRKLNWEVSARWNFGSELPFTQVQGYYQPLDFGDIGTDIATQNPNEIGIQFAELNKGRLPHYHRLDFNVKKTIQFKKSIQQGEIMIEKNTGQLEINAGVTNLYDRLNIFYVDRIRGEKVYQLPILPSLGLNYTF